MLDEIVDLRHQGQHQPFQAVGVERIDLLGRHLELESDGLRRAQCYIAESQRRRGVSSYRPLFVVITLL